MRSALRLSALALGLLVAGCGDEATPPIGSAPPTDGPLPEFTLVDVNPTSATFQSPVSARAQLEKVSGWYFTRAS